MSMAAGGPALDLAMQSFLALPAAIAAIYNAVGDRRIARSDFGFSIVDWMSYMVSIEPYIRRGLGCQDIELQARRILDLCAWLGRWLYSIGFRQSRALAKRYTLRGLRFPYLWLSKKYQHFDTKLKLIKSEGEQLKRSLDACPAGQTHASLIRSQSEDQSLTPDAPAPSASRIRMINESANNLNSISIRLLKT
ncbi:conserved hypothetical protein [Coccidioides posadasii str. Silveira]|uniref:Uncharacterized protein n=2 Tax=Coccidioides posadasii TaxID=199306 RepID=E9DHX6_COCPS|nr:conserved hypothetical protein [Coccidioides posadasii str. Silveira]KMM69530.1 hypothetical protein CPAG_05845 [Coccidioides posadasii RMSCC 3488]